MRRSLNGIGGESKDGLQSHQPQGREEKKGCPESKKRRKLGDHKILGLTEEQFSLLTEEQKSRALLLQRATVQAPPREPLSESFKNIAVELVKFGDRGFFTVFLASNRARIRQILEIRDARGETLLMIAIRSKNPAMVREIRCELETFEEIIQFPPRWLTIKNSQGETVLDIANKIGNSSILKLLTYQDDPEEEKPREFPHTKKYRIKPAPQLFGEKKAMGLPSAPDPFRIIEQNNIRIFDEFARNTQLDINSIKENLTLLMYAINKKSFNIVRHLLLNFNNIDVDRATSTGETALTCALRSGEKYLIKDIVSKKRKLPSSLEWGMASKNNLFLQILTSQFGAPSIFFSESKKESGIPLPALNGDYLYAILEAPIPNPFVAFKRNETKGDGNCSFSAMGTTREYFCNFMVSHFENLRNQSQQLSASTEVKEKFRILKERIKETIFYTILEDFLVFTSESQLEKKECQYKKMFQNIYSEMDDLAQGNLSFLIGKNNPLQELIKIFVMYKKTQLTRSEEEAKPILESFYHRCDDSMLLAFLHMFRYGSAEKEQDNYKLWPDLNLCVFFSEAQGNFPDEHGITTRFVFWRNDGNKLTCIYPEPHLERDQLLFQPHPDRRVIHVLFNPNQLHFDSLIFLGNTPQLIHQLCISEAMKGNFSSLNTLYKNNKPYLLEAFQIIFAHLQNNPTPLLKAQLDTSIRGLFDAGLSIEGAEISDFSPLQLDYLKKIKQTTPPHLSSFPGRLQGSGGILTPAPKTVSNPHISI